MRNLMFFSIVVVALVGAMDVQAGDAELVDKLGLRVSYANMPRGSVDNDFGRKFPNGDKANGDCGGEDICEIVEVNLKNVNRSLTIRRTYSQHLPSLYWLSLWAKGKMTEKRGLTRPEAMRVSEKYLEGGEVKGFVFSDDITPDEIGLIVKKAFDQLRPLEGEQK